MLKKSKTHTHKRKPRSLRKVKLLKFFVSAKEKESFFENFTMLLDSGINISDILKILKKETHSYAMGVLISFIYKEIDRGEKLWVALKHTSLLSEYFISLVRMGEESGTLVENLTLIQKQQEKERNYNSKIKSAMLYPIFVMTLTIVVGLGTAWFVLPRLTSVFSSLDVELPFTTKFLISISNFIVNYGSIFIPSFIAVIILLLYFLFVFKHTKTIGLWILFKTPGVGKLVQYVELARLGHFLGILLEAGMPILRSLKSSTQASRFKLYSNLYKKMYEDIKSGLSIEESFKKTKNTRKLIPLPVQQLIIAGERSGSLSNSLLRVGKTFEAKIDVTTKNLSVILEPILLVIVWVGVLFVALAIILPIYTLVGGINVFQQGSSSNLNQIPIETATEMPIITSSTENILETVSTTLPLEITSTTPEIISLGKIKILLTTTGFLNVRSEPSLGGSIITKVYPDEIYNVTAIKSGWYNIDLPNEQTGWVYSIYTDFLE
jgi:type II secretory pathway component PulF